MKKVIQKPFETEFGLVQVGDPVAVVTTSAHRIDIKPGIYLGYHESVNWRNTTVRFVKARVTEEVYRYVCKKTGKFVNWNHSNAEYKKVRQERITTLQNNFIIPVRGLYEV